MSFSSPTSSPLSSLSWSQAKVDNEIIDYRDLAAIPRVKAIYDIEHPDMISYKCTNGYSSTLDNKGNRQDRQSPAEVTSSNVPVIPSDMFVCHCFGVFFFNLGLIYKSNQTKGGVVLLCWYLTLFGPKSKYIYCEKWADVY